MESARPWSTASAALHGRVRHRELRDRGAGGSPCPPPTQPKPGSLQTHTQGPGLRGAGEREQAWPARGTYVLARWVVKTYTYCEGGFPGTPPPPPPGASGRRPGGGPWGGPGALLSLRGSWVVWPGPSCGAAMAGSATLLSA